MAFEVYKKIVREEDVKSQQPKQKYFDEYTGTYIECRNYRDYLHKAIKKYDFTTNTIVEEGYTSNADTLVTVYAPDPTREGEEMEMQFVDFKAALLHKELKFKHSTDFFYHKDLRKNPRKLNWNQDRSRNAIKVVLDPKEILTKQQYELAYNRGQITTSYNGTFGLKYTFGVELETASGYIPRFILSQLNAKTVRDGSITGFEMVSGILKGDSGLFQLNQQCYYNSKACTIDNKCGIHFHVGGFNPTKLFTVAAYKLGLLIQDELFQMFPVSRLITRNEYYMTRGRQGTSCCAKIPLLRGFTRPHNYEHGSVGNNIKHVEDLYHEIFNWLAEGKNLDNKYNKLHKHHNQYPSSRYVWLNLVPCNFNRTKDIGAPSKKSKAKQAQLSLVKRGATIEFRNHSASLSYPKIYKWLLFTMAFTAFVENNGYRILDASKITIADILTFVYGEKNAKPIIDYIEARKAKYGSLNAEESARVEDEEYEDDIKETELFTNKLDIIKCV